ncbi:MAG: hypothetical protein M0042_14425 [Nitrospiraceae bacterium]|nr:hypothetical protein [Nitrospiraceae bacterium]
MQAFHAARAAIFASMLFFLPLLSAARGETTFGAEVRESYEDNVIGLTADKGSLFGGYGYSGGTGMMAFGMNNMPGQGPGGSGGSGGATKLSDFSTHVTANIGYAGDASDHTSTLVEAEVTHASYNKYSAFDFTIGTISAGLSYDVTESITLRAAALGRKKWYDDSQRNSVSYGGSLGIKERLTESFWLNQSWEIEQNTASSSLYSYVGNFFTASAGIDVTDDTTVSAGYTYIVKDFNKTTPSLRVTSQIAFLEWSTDIGDHWGVSAGYDHEWADSNVPGTAAGNNIYSVGIRYDY